MLIWAEGHALFKGKEHVVIASRPPSGREVVEQASAGDRLRGGKEGIAEGKEREEKEKVLQI